MKSGPRSPQLEKALAQKRGPNTAKNKLKTKNKKQKLGIIWELCEVKDMLANLVMVNI